jgi:serine/threonine protein kinase/flagellar motor protein MotB
VTKPTVSLVELDAPLAAGLTKHLYQHGISVAPVSAEHAIAKLRSTVPNVAFVSLELSQGSGFGLINRARRMEALRHLPMVLVSSDATEDALEAHRAGPTPADAYLSRALVGSGDALLERCIAEADRLLADVLLRIDDDDDNPQESDDALAKPPGDEPASIADLIAEMGGFRVVRRLKHDEDGSLFACMDEELDRPVAIKLLEDETDAESERVQRFLRERRVLALVQSPHVLAVYQAGTHRGVPFIVREFLDGEDLERRVRRDGPLDVDVGLGYARETALALKAAADVGVIHRDVRPANIYVVDDHVKLARFGLARLLSAHEPRITREINIVANVHYAAPERTQGQEDERSDIYSLGVTLHTLLAGTTPFSREAPLDLADGSFLERPMPLDAARSDAPKPVVELVAKLMAQDPAERPQSWDDVIAAIDDVAGSPDTPGATDPAKETGVRGTLRRMRVAEIAQTLELAGKSAKVTIEPADGEPGLLSFVGGRLVHASTDELNSDEAFFELARHKAGSFRVDYAAKPLEANIATPLQGLLLEAARRADDARGGRPAPPPRKPPQPAAVSGAALPAAAVEPPTVFDDEDEDGDDQGGIRCRSCGALMAYDARSCMFCGAPTEVPLKIPTWAGLLTVGVVTLLAVIIGLNLPDDDPPVEPDTAATGLADVLAKERAKVSDLRATLTSTSAELQELSDERDARVAAAETVAAAVAESHELLAAALEPELVARKLRLRPDEGHVVVEIQGEALFARNTDGFTRPGMDLLERVAAAIAAQRGVRVRVEGHTDNRKVNPRTKWRDRAGLSGARALEAQRFLADKGVPRARMTSHALADSRPLASNRGPKGRARNRRVELHVVPAAAAK